MLILILSIVSAIVSILIGTFAYFLISEKHEYEQAICSGCGYHDCQCSPTRAAEAAFHGICEEQGITSTQMKDDIWPIFLAGWEHQQAKIDRLMLEYCPEEMTKPQVKAWAATQRADKDQQL